MALLWSISRDNADTVQRRYSRGSLENGWESTPEDAANRLTGRVVLEDDTVGVEVDVDIFFLCVATKTVGGSP